MGELVGMDGAPVAVAPVDGIHAFDQDGREVVVPREQWRTDVLPGMLQQVWDDADQMYMLLANSLRDGFLAEIADAAKHLYEVDPIAARGASMWGIVLLQLGRLDEAAEVLEGFVARHGEEGSVLTNLAKVYDSRGDAARAEATLWRAIEVDPNVEAAVGWWLARANEAGGDAAVEAAIAQVAAIPTSWLGRLGQASRALRGGDLAAAVALYGEALARAKGLGLPAAPGQLLMQMSGELGAAGHIAELVELTAPSFVPEFHGLAVGNNLLKAYCDLGRLDEAVAVVGSLTRLEHPEWKQALAGWEQEILRLRGVPDGVQIGMLRVDGPVWLPAGSPGWQIFGAKATATVAVTFLGGTVETAPGMTASEAMGRMSRALPLYLAEQVELRSAAQGRAMLPWAIGPQSGFVVSGQAWTDEQTVAAAAASTGGIASTYCVSVHVDADAEAGEPWTAELRFVRASDGVQIGELTAEFAGDAPEDGLAGLADEVVELMAAVAPGAGDASGRYVVPEGTAFLPYLGRLEQLLAVRCAAMAAENGALPEGLMPMEQAMLDDLLAACEALPANVPLRLLLIETMSALHRIRPELVEAYRGKVDALMAERPIA